MLICDGWRTRWSCRKANCNRLSLDTLTFTLSMAIPELLGSVTSSQLWSFGALFLILSFIVDFASHPQYPSQIPVMGKGHGMLNALLDSFRYLTNYHRWVSDGYVKVSSSTFPNKVLLKMINQSFCSLAKKACHLSCDPRYLALQKSSSLATRLAG